MVSTSLFTGLTGLRLHQSYIDIIGNNLANVSTAGFRGSRATFSDLLSFTLNSGSAANGNFGGTNPLQIGHGAVLGTVDIDTTQGTFQDTGRPLDVAIQGRGFFTLTDGTRRYYTRVGTFGVDNDRALVDIRTGLYVCNASGGKISVPVTDTLPAHATSSITLQGNLPAQVTGPFAEIVESSAALRAGTAATRRATANVAGPPPQFDLRAFAGRSVLVAVDGGAQQTVTFPAAIFGAAPVNASTVAAQFAVAGLQVSADDVNGTIDFSTVRLGDDATLKFDDGPQATGLLATLGLGAALVRGTETAPGGATDLASLTARRAAYVAGDRITISGTNPDGTPFSDTFVYGAGNNGTTLQDLVNFVNNTLDATQATASLTADGHIRVTATDKEPAQLSLAIGDAAGNTGGNDWPEMRVLQEGTGPDTATTAIDVIDAQGLSHSVTLKFTRSTTDSSVWDLTASMDASQGAISQPTIGQIRFNNDGSFGVVGGGSNALRFDFTGIGTTQSVAVDLGSPGSFDGVVMMGAQATVAATDQDGYGPGSLVDVAFDADGNLTGFYTNGQSQVIDKLRLSMFANEAGLLRVGDTMYVESPNSDDAIFTTANAGGAGSIRPGSLENSNVDIAREFVDLIEAQRGFQANSRVITTTDEMLAELMNIVK